ncbi:barstar family protein [Auraticoccus monumenti]|uniref:Barstar, RNAse (Barnase) inhibitor n=1 Tax=Auraticoccus monumenti TaxID=675864 RepID=A0A1G7DRD3_9ACTN|nr:barstar family protein [Auraticoccus monumenti]SDE53720.1 Barstar, RNAse (barnase) inhibitor [Auraticoccus monumenti]
MSDPASLLEGTDRAAVVRALGAPQEVAEELALVGWTVAWLPPVTDLDAFYAALGEVLGRRHLGANLDALWDVLGDLTAPTVLLWPGWDELAVADPRGTARLLRVLEQRAADPGLAPVATVLL